MRSAIWRRGAAVLAAVILLGGMTGCGSTPAEVTQRENDIPTEAEVVELFDQAARVEITADAAAALGGAFVTQAFYAEEGAVQFLTPEEIQVMAKDGGLNDMVKWSADYSGASSLVIGGAVTVNLTGTYQYAAIGWCDGMFLIVEGDNLTDIHAVFA